MANTAFQLFGYILAYIGFFGILASTFMTEWKTYARPNGEAIHQEENVGLWMKCTKGAAGLVTCTPFHSMLFQPKEINISRGVMVASIVLCGLASLVGILGLKCTKCLDANKHVKSAVATVAGVLFILGGLCALGLISWFAHGIAQDFHNGSAATNKYEFGSALFVGWGAAVFSITGGTILCICSRTFKQHKPYTSKTHISDETGKEYV